MSSLVLCPSYICFSEHLSMSFTHCLIGRSVTLSFQSLSVFLPQSSIRQVVCKAFSQSASCLSALSAGSFQAEVSHCDETQFIRFCLYGPCTCVTSRHPLSNPGPKHFAFFLQVLYFIFKSAIHFELILYKVCRLGHVWTPTC